MKQLDPKAVWLFFLSSVLKWSLIGVILSFWLGSIFMSTLRIVGPLSLYFLQWLWIIIPLWLVFLYVVAKLTYRFYRYELTDNGFRKESGIIWKRYITIPYDRIQNVDIYRGVLARILGLSDLHIQTAGTAGFAQRGLFGGTRAPEGQLPGLSQKVAEQLRDELISRDRQPKNQGL